MTQTVEPRTDDPLVVITDRLLAEYRGKLAPDIVRRCVAHCRTQLRRAGVQAGLEHAVEAMARYRLRHLLTAAGAPC